MERSQLQEIIREAIVRADVEASVASEIMAAAEEAERMAWGTMYDRISQCGCPIIQAGYYIVTDPIKGLVDPTQKLYDVGGYDSVVGFIRAYDDLMGKWAATHDALDDWHVEVSK